MFLVVGLGNSPDEYQNTRHNIGFKVIDELANRNEITDKHIKSDIRQKARWFKFSIDTVDLIAAQPLTFMNSNGISVKKLLQSFALGADNLIVVHDDLDLEFGKIRVKKGSSSGGHLGIDSIIQSIGTNNFYRVRVGIGRPSGKKDPFLFVLEPFKKKEIETAEFAVYRAADAIIDLVKYGLEYTMNKYN